MTKGVVAMLQDFIGPSRRPYLVVDVTASTAGKTEMGARGAAIQGLQPFASEMNYCLKLDASGEPVLDQEVLLQFAKKHAGAKVLIYGFTYMLWNQLVKPLLAAGECLGLLERPHPPQRRLEKVAASLGGQKGLQRRAG